MKPRQPGDPLVVYLDMNVWVQMALGIANRVTRWTDSVDNLKRLSESGRCIVPLSPAHYLELWHRGTQESREDIGRLMRDLSGYATLAPLPTIRQLEVGAFVSRFMDNDTWVGPVDVLGTGACHAFGSRFGRFRFVESLASRDGVVPEGRPVEAPANLAAMELSGRSWEWVQLVGTAEIVGNPGIERAPEHRLGTEGVSEELKLRELLRGQQWARDRLRDLLNTAEITSLTDVINRTCLLARVEPHSLFLENPEFATPAEAMRAFVLGLPSVDVLATLREWKHRDLTHPWDQHDRTDIQALSAAIPYADIVITERRWAHLANASGLAKRYATNVRGLSEFEAVFQKLTLDAGAENMR